MFCSFEAELTHWNQENIFNNHPKNTHLSEEAEPRVRYNMNLVLYCLIFTCMCCACERAGNNALHFEKGFNVGAWLSISGTNINAHLSVGFESSCQ